MQLDFEVRQLLDAGLADAGELSLQRPQLFQVARRASLSMVLPSSSTLAIILLHVCVGSEAKCRRWNAKCAQNAYGENAVYFWFSSALCLACAPAPKFAAIAAPTAG